MKISIQIPTYNQELLISRAIESALLQDYAEKEIVILDDCSIDGTSAIAKQFISRGVRYFRNEVNLGRARTYRKLLYDLISGDWVVNLDGDDFFSDPCFISKAVTAIKNVQDAVLYQACIKSGGQAVEYIFRHELLEGKNLQCFSGSDYFKGFYRNRFFAHLSSVYHVELARQVGFYESNNLNTDAESILKLALKGNVILSSDVVGVWNIHSANESNNFALKSLETRASLERLQLYGSIHIGWPAANRWFEEAIRNLNYNVMEQLANQNFLAFFSLSIQKMYFNSHFFKLLVKKALFKI